MTERKKAEAAERASRLRRALLLPASPRFGQLQLRPFSLWTLDLCEEIGLELFLKLPDQVEPAGDEEFQLLALIWFHDQANPVGSVDQALASGAWRDQVNGYRRNAGVFEQLEQLEDYIVLYRELIQAATVRVKKKPKRKGEKEERTPSSVIEPGQTYSLIWTIAGERIDGPEHYNRLYRETPLPVILSFYHCALRTSLLWTVPPKRPVDKKKREKAALARRQLQEKRKSGGEVDFF